MRRFRSERIYLAAFVAVLACSCVKDNVAEMDDAEKLPEPRAVVSDMGCASFKVSWDAVTDAGSYTYVFNGGDTLTTKKTSLMFTDLSPKSEYTFALRADAGNNGTRRNSNFVNFRIVTDDITVLDTPVPEAVATYVSKTIFRWEPVSGATSYEYSVGNFTGTSTKCMVELSGFEPSTEYVFRLKALSEEKYVNDSAEASLKFVTRPASDDIPQIVCSHVETGADYTTFNVYALPDFRYLYFCWPETYLTGMSDTEIRDMYLKLWLQALKDEGTDVSTGVSQYSYSGTSSYVGSQLCSELTYRVGVFGVDKAGNAVTPLYGYTTKTLAENSSPLPDYSGADWFMQGLMLPTGTGSVNATNCLGLFWIGKDVTRVVSILTSTRSYKNYFASTPDLFAEYVAEYGTVTEDAVSLAGINSDNGFTATFQGLSSATSYTAGAVVTNSANETAFFLNSMPTRSSTSHVSWANVTLGRSTQHPTESSLAATFNIAFDPASEPYNFHVSGIRYCFCKYSELDENKSSEQIVRESGVDMPQSSIDLMNMSGTLSMIFGIDGTPLEPRTKYALLATFTERNGDTVTSAAAATTAVSATKSATISPSVYGKPSGRILFNAPAIIDVYEPIGTNER